MLIDRQPAISGLHTLMSGQHVYVESGVYTIPQSGQGVLISGQHVYVESGVHVVADVNVEVSSGLWVDGISGVHVYQESGAHNIVGYCIDQQGQHIPTTLLTDCSGKLFTLISGQHVYVESGVHVIADVNVEVSSGLWVDGVSGVHVYQESGAFITTQPNIGISGTVTVESGLHVWVSGQHLYQESGAFVTTQPNIGISGTVTVESGLHVWVSGQHVYQESGAFVITQPDIGISGTVTVVGAATAGSGQMVHIGCAADVRTGDLVQLIGGTSGWPGSGSYHGSGGMSLCVSGQWCSGPIHSLVIKNRAGNDVVLVGGVNCKPYSGGYGYELDPSEAVNLDMCDVCDVWVWGFTSGQAITWIGTNY